jgi:hypothetical protein
MILIPSYLPSIVAHRRFSLGWERWEEVVRDHFGNGRVIALRYRDRFEQRYRDRTRASSKQPLSHLDTPR